uniref:Variant surface glycoprotein n=1 Tax=Trypanosoma brucei TaxID=5691 RepID=A0A1V0G082_9TRYP|nr:variant surface glycoprotein [Trypanosoma brucei]
MSARLHQAILVLYFAAQASAQETQLAACGSTCACERRAVNTASHLDKAIEAAANTLADNAAKAVKLSAAAAAATDGDKQILAPAASVALKYLLQQTTDFAAAAPKVISGSRLLNSLAAHYRALEAMKRAGDTAKIAGTVGGNYAAGTYTAETLTAKKASQCSDLEQEDKLTADQLVLAENMNFKDEKLYSAIAMACQLANQAVCTGATTSDFILAKVTLSTIQTTASGSALSNGGFATIAAGPILEPPITNANINGEITELKNAVQKLQEIKTIADSTLYSTDDTVVKFVARQVFKVAASDKPTQQQETEIATHIKETYGANAGDFQTKIWRKVENTEVSFNGPKAIETKQLSKVTPEAAVASTIAVSLANQQNSDGKACPQPQAPDNKVEKCVGKKGDACTGDCELDGEICKQKKKGDEENKEKDGKAASTCAGKKQGECEKENGCKWEGTECKDSSILLTKKFALSVVSAAFAALLF